MTIPFYKYQGAGNDFIIIDNREKSYLNPNDQVLIERLCDRRFGIGADGLILLNNLEGYDFEMVYFNADGQGSSMCGNGGRCIVAFAKHLGIIDKQCTFLAIDGPHEAIIEATDWVELKMTDVQQIEIGENYYYLDTGSPHYVLFKDTLSDLDVVKEGRSIRYSDRFKEVGTNVNFVETNSKGIAVATYERGVEDETLACGTGVTACAIAHYLKHNKSIEPKVEIQAKGGQLKVRFESVGTGFTNIWLCGPAQLVFKGEIELNKL